MASHALAAMLPSHLNWRMHEAFLYYLVFVLNHVLEETCADIHGLGRLHRRRTVGAPYNSVCIAFVCSRSFILPLHDAFEGKESATT